MFKKRFDTIYIAYSTPNVKRYSLTNLASKTLKKRIIISIDDFEWGKPISGSLAISYNLILALQKLGNVQLYPIGSNKDIELGKNDIFIGHPWPDFATKKTDENFWFNYDKNQITNKIILKYPNDKRIFAISPFNLGKGQFDWGIPLYDKLNKYIGICGDMWVQDIEHNSSYFNLLNFKSVNMAVNPNDFPFLKKKFNPAGKRKFLYIGRDSVEKGTKHLVKMKELDNSLEIATIGCKLQNINCIAERANLNKDFISNIVNDYDFVISMAEMDAQATTILEAMCWGFPVAATPETGYNHDSVFKLDFNDLEHSVSQLIKMNYASEQDLLDRQKTNMRLIKEKYSWDIFRDQIQKTILQTI